MIRDEVFARYAAMRVPRYTSYPTAPNFCAAKGDGLQREWLRQVPADEPMSVYVHVPFCRAMCWYCGCNTTVTRRAAPIARYVLNLVREIELVADAIGSRPTVSHFHWGGGTPTLLSPRAIRLVDGRLRQSFDFEPDAELSLEVDPRTLSAPVGAAFAATGVNRVSLGVQTFDLAVQQAIGRVQSFEQTRRAVSLFRHLGVRGVSFDLIYGLPLQTTASCIETVHQALELRPDRLAVFGYAHVPSFKPHQRNIAETALPDGSARLEQVEAIAAELIAAGYQQIGLDHFALPDDPLARAGRAGTLRRNFQGYTTDTCRTLVGLGASAISRLPGGFVQNASRIPQYSATIDDDSLAAARICPVSAEDQRRARIIEQLMCNYRADLGSVLPASLEELERDGLVRRLGSSIQIPDDARPLVRAVAAAFDAYLPQSTARHVQAV